MYQFIKGLCILFIFTLPVSAETLLLDLKPKILDHRGGDFLYKVSQENFTEQYLPYADTYISVDTNRRDLDIVGNWIAQDDRGAKVLVVNLNNWIFLPKDIQNQAYLTHYIRLSGFTAYDILSIDYSSGNELNQNLKQKPFLDSKSKFDWAHKWMGRNQFQVNANCFSLALSASGYNFNFPGQVNPEEFEKLLQKKYQRVDEPTTGNIAVFSTKEKTVIHAAVLFGISRSNRMQRIFLSKNGRGNGVILFVDEYTLRNRHYPETSEIAHDL